MGRFTDIFWDSFSNLVVTVEQSCGGTRDPSRKEASASRSFAVDCIGLPVRKDVDFGAKVKFMPLFRFVLVAFDVIDRCHDRKGVDGGSDRLEYVVVRAESGEGWALCRDSSVNIFDNTFIVNGDLEWWWDVASVIRELS